MTTVPHGWTLTTIDDFAEVQGGIQKQPKRRPSRNKFPFLRVANVLRDRLDLEEVHEIELFAGEIDRFRLQSGDLLIVEGNGSPSEVGRAALWKGQIKDCVHQNHIIRVRPSEGINSSYLNYFWNSPKAQDHLRQVASSTSGLYVLSGRKVKQVQVPVAPPREQERIVAAIDEQFSRLDSGVRSLDRAKVGLTNLRAAILSAAISGRLVPQDTTEEPASAIVERCSAERRRVLGRRWKPPTDVDSVPFSRLPEGWLWTNLDALTGDARYGTSVKCSVSETGPLVLRIPNIKRGRVVTDNAKFAPVGDDLSGLYVEADDLLFVRTNGSRDLIGRAGVAPHLTDTAFASYLIRVRPLPCGIVSRYLGFVFDSPHLRALIEAKAASSAGQYNLSLGALRSLPVPLPPSAEQARVVTEVDRQFSILDSLEVTLHDALARAAGLRRSVLDTAFRGRLISHKLNDRPLGEMLETTSVSRPPLLKFTRGD